MKKAKMLPKVKVYEVDYGFILENYLDVSLWYKEWVLFEYSDYRITLKLNNIYCQSNVLTFEISIFDNSEDEWFNNSDTVWFYFVSMTTEHLKQKINGSIFYLIGKLEYQKIKETNEYHRAKELCVLEEEKLRGIAEDFLDNEGVKNEEIREVYIENYIDKNKTSYEIMDNVETTLEFTILTDLYVAYLGGQKDNGSISRLERIKNKVGEIEIQRLKEYFEEYSDKLESKNYIDEMQENLEAI